MKYIKKNKFSIVFEILIVSIFAFPTHSVSNYYCLFSLFIISLINFHVHKKLDGDMTLTRELFDHEKNKTAIRIIEDLSSEIVYPTKSEAWKSGLLDSVKNLKEEILRD